MLNDFSNQQLLRNRPSFDYLEQVEEKSEKKLINPNDFSTIFLRAINYLDEEIYDSAKLDLNYLISKNPSFGGSYYYRGICYKSEFKIDSAIADFKKAVRLSDLDFYAPSYLEIGYIKAFFFEDITSAKEQFELAYKFNKEDYSVNYALGYSSFKMGQIEEAIHYSKNCIKLEPLRTEGYFLLMELRVNQGLFGKAQNVLNRLLEHHDNDESAQLAKARLYLIQGQKKKGTKLLDEILMENSDSPVALLMRGLIYFDNNEIAQGFRFCSKSFESIEFSNEEFGISKSRDQQLKLIYAINYISKEIDSYSPTMKNLALTCLNYIDNPKMSNYSGVFERIGDYTGFIPTGIYLLHAIVAESAFNKAYWESDNLKILERDSSIYHVYRSLGKFYVYNKNFDNAEKFFSKMLYLDRNRAEGYKLRGLNRARYRRFVKAIQDFNIYLNYNNLDTDILEYRANCYIQMGYTKLAIDDYETVLEISPYQVKGNAFVSLASIRQQQKDTAKAIALYDQAIDMLLRELPSDGKLLLYHAYNWRGRLKLESNQLDGALEDFASSIKLNTYYSMPYFYRGIALYKLGQYEKAESDFTVWLRGNHQERRGGLFWRGKTKVQLGDIEGAKSDLTEASEAGVIEAAELLKELNK